MPVFAWVERRAEAPLIRPALISRRPVQIACGLAVGAGLSEATFVFLSAYAVEAFSVSESAGSYLLLPLVLGVTVGSPLAGRMLDRVGPRPVVTGAMVLVVAGLVTVAVAPSLSVHIAGTVALGLGLAGILGSSLSYILLSESAVEERTVAQGLSTLFISVGQLVGAAALGAAAVSAAAPAAGYRTGFLMVAGVGVLLLLLARGLPSRQRPLAAA